MKEQKKGILLVSFGSSCEDSGAKSIDVIETQIRKRYPEAMVYHAWTSDRIRRRKKEKEGKTVYRAAEALEVMKHEGVQEIMVLPLFILKGSEYEQMMLEIQTAQDSRCFISAGEPLLGSREDCEAVSRLLLSVYQPKEGEQILFVGHGSEHRSDESYGIMKKLLLSGGDGKWMFGTLKGALSWETVQAALKEKNPEKVLLVPFMLTAGVHVMQEIAGDAEDSWKCRLEREGYETECVTRGLGECEGIRRIFLQHLDAAFRESFLKKKIEMTERQVRTDA